MDLLLTNEILSNSNSNNEAEEAISELENATQELSRKNIYNLRNLLNGHILYLKGRNTRPTNNEGIPMHNTNLTQVMIPAMREFLTGSLTNRSNGSIYQYITTSLMFAPLTNEQKERRTLQIIERIRDIRRILDELSRRKYPNTENYIRYTNEQLKNWIVNGIEPPQFLRTITPNRSTNRRRRSMTPLSNYSEGL